MAVGFDPRRASGALSGRELDPETGYGHSVCGIRGFLLCSLDALTDFQEDPLMARS